MSIPPIQYQTLTSTGSQTFLSTEYIPTWVKVSDVTSYSSLTGSASLLLSAEWNNLMKNGSALLMKTLGGATNPQTVVSSYITANGISIQGSSYTTTVGVSGSFLTVTASNPVTLTGVTATNLPSSGYLFIQNTTSSLQIQGRVFYYTYTGNTITLPYLNGSGFGSAGGSGSFYTVNNFLGQTKYPRSMITSVTTGQTFTTTAGSIPATIIGFSAPTTFAVGQKVNIRIPTVYSAQLAAFFSTRYFTYDTTSTINYPGYTILAVSGNTITIDADTSSITSNFTWPTNTTVAALQSQVLQEASAILAGEDPVKQTAYIAPVQPVTQGIILGSGVLGTVGDSLLVSYGCSSRPNA